MDRGAGHQWLLLSSAIGKVARRLRSHLSNHSDSYKGTMKMLDLLDSKVQILCSEHLLHIKPDKQLAVDEWYWRLNKATNEAADLLHDMETGVNADASKAFFGDLDLAAAQAIDWLRSDNRNLLRMKFTIGRLASICTEGGSIIDMPNLEESHLADLNKESTSLPSNISKNNTKPSLDDALIIGRDEEIAVILEMILGDARYAISSLEGREEADRLQISQKGWVVKTLEKIDIFDASQVGSGPEVIPYQNVTWNKVRYTRIPHSNTITDLRNPTVIPIVGIGGVGKTTLAKFIFNEERVQEHFKGKSAWVYVTDNTSEDKMMEHIISAFKNQAALTNVTDLHMELQSIIEGRKFLLVLDDVWGDTSSIWGNLRRTLSKGAPGSVVLITTQLYEVAKFMGTGRPCPIILDPLQSDDLWKLIKHYAFADSFNYRYAEELEPIGRNIADKLHGLPLAAKIIGALLKSNADEDHWNRLIKSWWWKISDITQSASVISTLGISYCILPAYLRQCFLFLSIFPRNYVFEKNKLSQMWTANGFIKPNSATSRNLEDITGQWFDELINQAFLGPSVCKTGFVMHDLVRDFALALSSNEFSTNDSSHILRYLSIEMDDANVQLSDFEIEQLKPIMLFSDFGQSSSSDVYRSLRKIEEGPKSLCILDFSCSWWCAPRACSVTLQQDRETPRRFPNAISRLKHLSYLDLSFTGINVIPDSICSLCHLQVLGLRGCTFDKLPANMNQLINLRQLHASTDTISQIYGIGKLTKLQELHEYRVEEEDGHRITELSDMNDLRGSLCISGLEMVSNPAEALEANIIGKKCLTALELRWTNYRNIEASLIMGIVKGLSPPSYLQELKFDGYSGFAFPEWVGQLNHVRIVEISSCKNLMVLPPLGQLENLQKLKLYELPSIKNIGSEFYGTSNMVFRSLEELSFKGMRGWKSWTYAGRSEFIPNLQKLRISSCWELSQVPFESLGSTTKEIVLEACRLHVDMVSSYLQRLTDLIRLEVQGRLFIGGKLLILPSKHLRSLEYLHIKECGDVCIEGGLWYIRNLKHLHITWCRTNITVLAQEDKHNPTQIDCVMPSLTHLTLDDKIDPKNITQQTPSLRTVHIQYYLTSTMEQWLQQSTSVQELVFSQFRILPSSLPSLQSLKRFTLEYCIEIRSIPANMLPGNLKELQIEGCSIELEARCQNPNGEVWHPNEENMEVWRRKSMDVWRRNKIEYGRRKITEMQRKKEQDILMYKRDERVKGAGEESMDKSTKGGDERPNEEIMDEWRRSKEDYGCRKLTEMRQKKEEQKRVMNTRDVRVKGGREESMDQSTKGGGERPSKYQMFKWPFTRVWRKLNEALISYKQGPSLVRKGGEQDRRMNKRDESMKSAIEESMDESPGQSIEEVDESSRRLQMYQQSFTTANADKQLEAEEPLDEWLQQSEGDRSPKHNMYEVYSWVERRLAIALKSNQEGPSSLMKEREEWLKEEEREFRETTLGKDWPSIARVPYIRVNNRIVQNLYT